MPSVPVNYFAIVISMVVVVAIDMVWYSSFAFGNYCLKLSGMSKRELKESMWMGYAAGAIGSLIMAYVLAHIVYYVDATTVDEGVILGFWLWLGFVATVMAVNYVFGQKPLKLYLIDAGYWLVAIVTMGGMLAVLS